VSNIILDAIEKFPDYLDTRDDSNINKLVVVLFEELNNFMGTLDEIETNYDIDRATLDGLDQIGTNLDTARGGLEDEEYRARLKLRQAQNLADGTFSSIISILQSQLGIDDPSLIIIEELGNANLRVEVPIDDVGGGGFEGTFVYGDAGEDEFDVATGYGGFDSDFGGTYGSNLVDEESLEAYKKLVESIVAAGVGTEVAVTGTFVYGGEGEDEFDLATGYGGGTYGGVV